MSIAPEDLRSLSAFAAVAGEYCCCVDDMRNGSLAGRYARLQDLLARLNVAILPVRSDVGRRRKQRKLEALKLTTDGFEQLLDSLCEITAIEIQKLSQWHLTKCAVLPKLDRRNGADDGRAESDRSKCFAADIAEIYEDLHYGLRLWEVGTPTALAEAAWQWRFCYEVHWGYHLFRALTTVHEMLYLVSDE